MKKQLVFAITPASLKLDMKKQNLLSSLSKECSMFNGGIGLMTTEEQVNHLAKRANFHGLDYNNYNEDDHTIEIVNKRTRTVYATVTKVNLF